MQLKIDFELPVTKDPFTGDIVEEEWDYEAMIRELVGRKEFKAAKNIYITYGSLCEKLLPAIRCFGKNIDVQMLHSYHIKQDGFPGKIHKVWSWKQNLNKYDLMIFDCQVATFKTPHTVRLHSWQHCETVRMLEDLGLADNCPRLALVQESKIGGYFHYSERDSDVTGIEALITVPRINK